MFQAGTCVTSPANMTSAFHVSYTHLGGKSTTLRCGNGMRLDGDPLRGRAACASGAVLTRHEVIEILLNNSCLVLVLVFIAV